MRIIRNDDHHGDDGHDHGENRRPEALGDMVANLSTDQVTDILADEFSDFLTAAVNYADNHAIPAERPFRAATPAKDAAPQPVTPAEPDHEAAPATPPEAAAIRSTGPRRAPMLRAAAGGSTFVVAAAALAVWGQPAAVTVPIGSLGVGWVAYLWWNAALRPPLPQVLAVIITAISRGIAHLASGVCTTVRKAVHRADTARTRHENPRTASA